MKRTLTTILLIIISYNAYSQAYLLRDFERQRDGLSHIISNYSLSDKVQNSAYIGFLFGLTWTIILPGENDNYYAYWGRLPEKDGYFEICDLKDATFSQMLQGNNSVVSKRYQVDSVYNVAYWYLSINNPDTNLHEEYSSMMVSRRPFFMKKKSIVPQQWLLSVFLPGYSAILYSIGKKAPIDSCSFIYYSKNNSGVFAPSDYQRQVY